MLLTWFVSMDLDAKRSSRDSVTLLNPARFPSLSFHHHHHPRDSGTSLQQHHEATVNHQSVRQEFDSQSKVGGQTTLSF